MKTQQAIQSHNRLIVLILTSFFGLVLFAVHTHAYAGDCAYKPVTKAYYVKHVYVPIAICNTIVSHSPLPVYVCCGERNNKGQDMWRNTWVAGSCGNASANAKYDMGCTTDSPVFGTNTPIVANCQFSRHHWFSDK